ncbi:MAG: hypothetical protein QME73_00350 [Bacillota bacterium]|nr:hypothetical protein [Bacillota bacterium]
MIAAFACFITVIISLFNRVGILAMSMRLLTAFTAFFIIGMAIKKLMTLELPEKVKGVSPDLNRAENKLESTADDEFMEYKPPVMQATEKHYPGRR